MLLCMLAVSMSPLLVQAKKPKLNRKWKVVEQGEVFFLRVKNTKKKVRWRSTNPDVVVLRPISRKKAVLKAKSPGRAYVVAKVGSRYLKCLIGVTAPENEADSGANTNTDITPDELPGSDLEIVHTVTKLDFPRWIQSFTMDDKYYYFIQMTSANTGNLRITRVKYAGLGKYLKDHMDLINFGHGTNLDCSTYNGVTYLWTGSGAKAGSDVSRAISCFPYVKNSRINNHSPISYLIPHLGKGSNVTNVYPAVNETGDKLMVRYTRSGKQYFQAYTLVNGTQINPKKPLFYMAFTLPVADFQGFDYYKNSVKTIEGSPSQVFLAGYDRTRTFYPTMIRTYTKGSKNVAKRVINGASALTFREPEGIKVTSSGQTIIMFVSNTLTDQSCNIYRVK